MPTIDEVIYQNECDRRDQKARVAGFLVLITGEVYERQYSRTSHVFVTVENGVWSAWRETWQPWNSELRTSSSQKVIAERVTFDQALMQARRYVGFVTKGRK
ncbi:hypothetical protein [Brevibacillus sp. NRS-1366]|uniref:hypothetical protein n=1 Tax=Brevibacillus sp. NRS-1366 TaxID=3233899 RepID=UPI003D1B0071